MNSREPLSRRSLLRGASGIAVGLPLLEEMMTGSVCAAATAKVPIRSFNVFFGLGIPAPLQKEGFEGVMEPLKPLADKLLIMRDIDHVRCDQKGINAHFDGSSAAFTAEPPNGEARAGGASIDQMIREAHYAKGMPSGMVPTLLGGTFFRRSRISRYVHSYRRDGSVAATMLEKPRDVFARVFGDVSIDPDGNFDEARVKHSVLDSVVDQYKYFTGNNSPLGNDSKSRMAIHLDRIREYEKRAYSMKDIADGAPGMPPSSHLPHGGSADPGGQGIDITLAELTEEWRLMADLYAMAIQMDKVRFGSITFLAAGERIRLSGDYIYNGEKRFRFDDRGQRNASGEKGCSHEWWHAFNPAKKNEQLRAHAHMKMREVAYFLQLLDGTEAQEANGKSILENSLFTISTESGDGRHADVKRELSGVFHAVSSANGRFKTGQIMDVGAEGIDVYNSMLKGMGVSEKLGPKNREVLKVDKIRA